MGSPVSPIFADLVMEDLEINCLNSLSSSPLIYCRYVDDIFAIVLEDKIDEILMEFNNYHPRLKFTHD